MNEISKAILICLQLLLKGGIMPGIKFLKTWNIP